MPLKAVLFDMDETLVDWSQREGDRVEVRRLHLQKLYDYLAEAGHELPDMDVFGQTYASILSTRWRSIDPLAEKTPRYTDILREILHHIELPVDTLDFPHLQTLVVGLLQTGVRAFADARAVLETIRAAGVRTGLLTNAPYPMFIREAELEALNLHGLLDVRLTAEDVGYQKPNPAAFLSLLQKLGATPDEAVFVGDDLKDDVSGAQRAGMRAVWVKRMNNSNPHAIIPNATIDQLGELPAILDGWFPGWR
jgi:putative hydrolase of the HAD superfamily